MAYRVFINNKEIEVIDNDNISRTLQVNDIANLATRQASFTANIKAPFTPENIKTFNYLGVVGNQSNVPYTQNLATILDENGEALVYKGYAKFTTTSDHYAITIYDGNIDLYKAIENANLSELNINDLNHTKSLSAVTNSWISNTNYKYILADYNGKTTFDTNKLNIDYLVPSVNVKYIWNKIFQKYGFTFSGEIFNSEEFTNLWMSYPKGITTSDSSIIIFDAEARLPLSVGGQGNRIPFPYINVNLLTSFLNNIFMKVAETATYRIELEGIINTTGANTFKIALGKNQTITSGSGSFVTIAESQEQGVDFNLQKAFNLNAGDDINVQFLPTAGSFNILNTSNLTVKLLKVQENNIDFGDAFEDFSIKDFFNEILWRFGLTSFKNKYTKNITFLTQSEQYSLSDSNYVDWSEKFVAKESENYQIGSYAKRNTFCYKYNDEAETHNDGYFLVDDFNLPDEKVVIQSKIYSPEKQLVDYFGRNSNVYKFWDKEVSENTGTQEVKYKSLDKRFYFLRSQDYTFTETQIIGSEQFGQETAITTAPVESFRNLPFGDITQTYYSATKNIIDKSLIIKAKLYLNDVDITNFDFRKIYYFSQLGGYFVINKINSYRPKKLTTCELIRLANPLGTIDENAEKSIQILESSFQKTPEDTFIITLNFGTTYAPPDTFKVQRSLHGALWTSFDFPALSPMYLLISNAGDWRFRLYDEENDIYSNIITLELV